MLYSMLYSDTKQAPTLTKHTLQTYSTLSILTQGQVFIKHISVLY